MKKTNSNKRQTKRTSNKESMLINESTVRRYMGLAGIPALSEEFVSQLQQKQVQHLPEEDELEDEIPMGDELPPEDDMGDMEEVPMDDEEEELPMGESKKEVKEEKVEEDEDKVDESAENSFKGVSDQDLQKAPAPKGMGEQKKYTLTKEQLSEYAGKIAKRIARQYISEHLKNRKSKGNKKRK